MKDTMQLLFEIDDLNDEIESLRQQLASRDAEIAELKVVSDHNLTTYPKAAELLRAEVAGWKASAENRLQIQGQREETIATLREQAELYEKALTASWPNSSRSEALNYWNAAKKLAATEQKP